jgi:hypothetical protein
MDNLMNEAVPAALNILKGLGSAVIVAAVAWTAIRLALQPIRNPGLKWGISIVFCVGMIAAAHGIDVINYGTGPQGWWRAMFFGVLGGFLAPALHDQVIKRWLPFLATNGVRRKKKP